MAQPHSKLTEPAFIGFQIHHAQVDVYISVGISKENVK